MCRTERRSRSSTSSCRDRRGGGKPEIRKLFEEQGVEGATSTQAEVAKMLQEDFVRLGELARSIGVHAD